MKGFTKIVTMTAMLGMLGACSGMTKPKEFTEYLQPTWYESCKDYGTEYFTGGIKFWKTTDYYYACGSAVSGWENFAKVKSRNLAKDALADRLVGEMNSRTTIEYNEQGSTENLAASQQSQHLIVNKVKNTALAKYGEAEFTSYIKDGKFYAFTQIKLRAEDAELIIQKYNANMAAEKIVNTGSINDSANQL